MACAYTNVQRAALPTDNGGMEIETDCDSGLIAIELASEMEIER